MNNSERRASASNLIRRNHSVCTSRSHSLLRTGNHKEVWIEWPAGRSTVSALYIRVGHHHRSPTPLLTLQIGAPFLRSHRPGPLQSHATPWSCKSTAISRPTRPNPNSMTCYSMRCTFRPDQRWPSISLFTRDHCLHKYRRRIKHQPAPHQDEHGGERAPAGIQMLHFVEAHR